MVYTDSGNKCEVLSKKTVLITGISSSLSITLARYLAKVGFDVIGTSRTRHSESPHFRNVFAVDFLNEQTLPRNLGKIELFAVIHVAALTPKREQTNFHNINVEGPLNFFSSKYFNELEYFINISSCSVYGQKSGNFITELTPPLPDTDYGNSKLLFETSIESLFAAQERDTKFFHLRVPSLLGSRVSPGIFHRWLETSKQGGSLLIHNPDDPITGAIDESSIAQRLVPLLSDRNLTNSSGIEVAHSSGDITFFAAAVMFSDVLGGHFPLRANQNSRGRIFRSVKNSYWSEISTKNILNWFLDLALLRDD